MKSELTDSDFIVAKGPEGLTHVLEDLHKKCQIDAEFAEKKHQILYQLGNQESVITVDLSVHPYQFWYNDLMGRPATRAVKEVIARFIWEYDPE